MNIVEAKGVYIWIDYEFSDAYEWGEQERIFRDLLEPLGLTYSGAGGGLGIGWRDLDFNVPIGIDLDVIQDALMADQAFEFHVELGSIPQDEDDLTKDTHNDK